MVWRPGQRDPVHDHLTWCVTAVLQGTEYEEVFGCRGDPGGGRAQRQPGRHGQRLRPAGRHSPGHDIGDAVAVSLHVYGTDITRVGSSVRRVYDLPVRSPPCPAPFFITRLHRAVSRPLLAVLFFVADLR